MNKVKERQKSKLLQHTRNAFLTGILAAVPLLVTYLVFRWLFLALDNIFQPAIIFLVGRSLPGVGLVAVVLLVYLLGLIMTNIVGRRLVGAVNSMMCRAPVIGSIYGPAATEVVNAVRSLKQVPFKKVVIVEFPKLGMYSLGFVTGKPVDFRGQRRVPLFIPHTPTPMTGFLVLLSDEDILDTDLTVDEAKLLIQEEVNLVVLDVRTKEEYEGGHLTNAVLIPVSEFQDRLAELDKDKKIVVYCKAGIRSAEAGEMLVNNGFGSVYNLIGGIDAWIQAGGSVVSDGGG